MKNYMSVLLLFLVLPTAHAIDKNPIAFQTVEQETRYQELTNEFRCVVCQNQSVADSNAELAQDVRDVVRNMILEGKNDAEITTFLVDRYGDFVLYNPPLEPKTYVLWIAPAILLAIALFALIIFIRHHTKNTQQAPTLTQAEQQKLDQALKEE